MDTLVASLQIDKIEIIRHGMIILPSLMQFRSEDPYAVRYENSGETMEIIGTLAKISGLVECVNVCFSRDSG